jgi:peptidyl-dipeptidase Dcp
LVSTNFRKATKKIPSLLSINDIETLFHEFGHSLHGALSKVKIPSQLGTSVK